MGNKTRILIGGVLVVFGVWFYFTPHLAVLGLKAAAEANDAAKFSGYVNFPALKKDLKASCNAKLAPGAVKGKKPNPFAALGATVTAACINPMIETLVTPASLVTMFKGDKPQPGKNATRAKSSDPGTEISTSYESFDRFVVTIKKKGTTEEPTGLVFTRDRLFSWKLSALRLPMLSK
jgi:hypothetical protein